MKGECDICFKKAKTKRVLMELNGRVNVCKDCEKRLSAFIYKRYGSIN